MRHLLAVDFLSPIALVLISCSAIAGLRGDARYWSWSTLSDNEQFILVSLYPDSVEEQLITINECGWSSDVDRICETAEMRRLEAIYPASGVYRNDGSTTPLWTLTQFVAIANVSPDGTRVIEESDYSAFWFFELYVHDATGFVGEINDLQVAGIPAVACDRLSGAHELCVDSWVLSNDPSWSQLLIVWENGARSTVRLNDLSVIKSNATQYAVAAMLTTKQGVAVLLVVLGIVSFIIWVLSQLMLQRRGWGSEK